MKRFYIRFLFLGLLFIIIGQNSFAQTYKLRATSVAVKSQNERTGYWSNWSNWEQCNILVVMNIDQDVVTIYSKETQEYDIIEILSNDQRDSDGGVTTTLLCVDADGTRCHMRLRAQSDGQLQLYIDYKNLMFVYNVESR